MSLWSKLGTRAVFGMVMHELAESSSRLLVLSADTSTSAGLDRFRKSFPEKYIEVGIAEQNLIGVAAALSTDGWLPVAATFSPFITLRCLEQIKVMVAYNKAPVKLVGLASGVALGDLGYTHCSIEDIAAIRAVPNVLVFSPADCTELVKALPQILDYEGPMYIRLTGIAPMPRVYIEDYSFELGRPQKIKDGKNIAILANGAAVKIAVGTAERLALNGINPMVLNVHTILPDNDEWVLEHLSGYNLIVVIEEHSINGGLGTAVVEAVNSTNLLKRVLKIGLPHAYLKSGNYDYMLEQAELTPECIALKIEQLT
jgi:transketolase